MTLVRLINPFSLKQKMDPSMCQVIVIGAGPSGLFSAIKMAESRSDLDVTVLERCGEVGVPAKLCAGAIADYWLKYLDITPESSVIASKIRGIKIFSPNGSCLHYRFDEPAAYILRRGLFESWLAREAEKRGVTIRTGVRFRHLREGSIITDGGKFRAEVVVGADGASSLTRRELGLPIIDSREDTHVCHQYILEDCGLYQPDEALLWFGSQIAPRGYAWLFPRGKDAELGAGVPASIGNPKGYLTRFMRKNKVEGKVLSEGAGIVPTAPPDKKCYFNRHSMGVLLVGDAGRHVISSNGGGIATGMWSGRLAGEAVAEGEPWTYDKRRKELFKFLKRHYMIKKILYSLTDEELDKMVGTLSHFKVNTLNLKKEVFRAAVYAALRNPKLLWKFLPGILS